MASLSKSQGKTAKKEARPRSPPEKKSLKASEEMSCVSEQHAPSPPLKGEDIQALAIRSEDLKKLREPQPPSDQQKPAAMMRVLVRKPRPPEESRKGQRVVVVARPLAQASTNQPLDYTGPGGPRFDAQGMVLPHSILGSLEDFRRETEARGETELLSRIPDTQRRRPQVVGGQKGAGVRAPSFPAPPPPCAPPPPPSPPQLQREVQSHALQHWHSHMRQRRRQQDFISNLLQKPVEGLLMNQSNSFRQTQEQRELLSRALPAIHPGHGQRVGSEFWSLPEQFGEELSGVRATLTQTQRGRQQPLTHVAQPASIRHESGNIPLEACDGSRRTWDQSVYLKHCRQELRDVLKHLDFSQPEMDGLEVIGSGQPFTSITVERSPLLEEEERREELREAEQKENRDPLAQFDDVMLVPVLVPSLRFCGQRARWTGNGTSHKGEVGISARVLLEALEGESVSSDLQVHNEGSTAIYYSWQRLPRPCSFPHTHTHTHTQHFYFNTSTGVILPGETQRVEFTFKSERAGVLGEAWRFNTHPVLMGGASLQVILRGVALCQDRTADQRLAIQRELEQRVAVTVCRSLVCDVLRGVRTPERPGSPAELYTTEEEHFLSSNPRLQYQYETVEALKALWQQVAAAGDPWDLSVTRLRQVVLALPQGEDGPEAAQDGLTREGALEHYNSLLLQLARPQHTGRPLPRTSVGVQLWRELLDSLVSQALWLRHTLGLPDPLLHQENWGRLKKEEMKEDKREEKKEEKRGGPPPKEDKKVGSGKEEKKGAHKPAVKEKPVEERPPSKKKGRGEEVGRRGEEVGRCPGGKEGKEASPTSSSPETCYQDQPAASPVEPCALEQYRTQLHQQVCVLMEGLVDSLCQLLEEDAEA